MTDVKKWIDSNTQRKQNLKGYNSYVAPKPYFEYQADVFFTGDWNTSEDALAEQKIPAGVFMIDVFTKYVVVIPVNGKNDEQLSLGLVEGFHKMGHKPKVLLTDNEQAMSSDTIQNYLREQDIQHIIVRNHPHMAERAIRTIKNLIYDRFARAEKQWAYYDVLYASILKYNKKRFTVPLK